MNKPLQPPPTPDDDIGPLDEHGVQIWSPEEEAAIARLREDPDYRMGLDDAAADMEAERLYTQEQAAAGMVDMKRHWFAEKGVTPPPGYFDS